MYATPLNGNGTIHYHLYNSGLQPPTLKLHKKFIHSDKNLISKIFDSCNQKSLYCTILISQKLHSYICQNAFNPKKALTKQNVSLHNSEMESK
jgi:hypothetical protein